MTIEEQKQTLREEITRIESKLHDMQPALNADAHRDVAKLSRNLVCKKQLLLMYSFPNGN